jgi:ligand-binding SRPBCC domain-containing protein
MANIHLVTKIKASKKIVFDISRNIDIHQKSASNLNETVTWRGKHFGFYLTHKSRITVMDLSDYFVDEMEEGKFKTFKHQHFFEEINGVTTMTDLLEYETPFGIFGKLFDVLFLKKHLTQFLLDRNKILKETAEKMNP